MSKTYKDAGVDIDAGNAFIKKIIPYVTSTYNSSVMAGVGGFAAHFELNVKDIKNPVLVASTDGIGTKLKIAKIVKKYGMLGQDLVAMCVNDIACSGASPLFFLDYFAANKLEIKAHSEIIAGIAAACEKIGCALIGGETAELPGIYPKKEFDLAGFAVGVIDKEKIVNGTTVFSGDKIIGIASSGIHSNGFSLVRYICENIDLNKEFENGETLGETLLTPTKLYTDLVKNLTAKFEIKSIAHITGGGLLENVGRTLPDDCRAKISLKSWKKPSIFEFLQREGGVAESEMQRVFNLGIGMTIVVSENDVSAILKEIESLDEGAYLIGEIERAKEGEPRVILE